MPPKKKAPKKKAKRLLTPEIIQAPASSNSDAEKQALFDQLTQLSRLASLGSLSSGIAHEINNPLVAVKGFAQLIEMDPGASAKTKEQAREIIEASVRIQKICDHLRNYAKEINKEEWEEVDLNHTIEQSMVLLSQQLRYRRIRVEVELEPKIPKVWGIRNALERVFHNLLTNSRDAFSSIGDERKRLIRIETRLHGDEVEVLYQDNAGGISPTIRRKVFEPFFSTRKHKSAAGLGLSIVLDIINEHQGSLGMETEEGGGTTLTLRLPIKAQSKIVSIKQAREVRETRGKWKLLIIDDEPVAAEVLAMYAKALFDSDICTNSRDALTKIDSGGYDLIVTDLNMPEVTGLDILHKVRDSGMNVPVIVMSGYSDGDEEVNEAMNHGATAFLQKPFEGPREVQDFLKGWIMTTQALETVRKR